MIEIEAVYPWREVEEQYKCTHAETQLVKYQQSHGAWRIRYQCLCCGEYTTSDQKMAGVDLDAMPVVDMALKAGYREKRQTAINNARYAYLSMQECQQLDIQARFWTNYNRYLRTKQWYTIREAVLKRDGYLCQACLTRKAVQVHHLSYELFNTLGQSAAFELVAICRQCHEKIHPNMAQAQEELAHYNPFLNGATNGQHR